MNKIILICFIFTLFVLSMYFFNFGTHFKLSKSTEVWAQFGDYLGGVVNPILTFFSVVLLIKTISLQREANESILKENRRQEGLDNLKNFEVRFYSLVEAQRVAFDSLVLTLSIEQEKREIKSSEAVNFIEELILSEKNRGVSKSRIADELDKLDVSDGIYSCLRKFYLSVKLIDDKLIGEDKSEYYEALINLTDFSLVRLLVLSTVIYDWDNASYIRDSNILGGKELRSYKEAFSLK